jgi:hypothetical protein
MIFSPPLAISSELFIIFDMMLLITPAYAEPPPIFSHYAISFSPFLRLYRHAITPTPLSH